MRAHCVGLTLALVMAGCSSDTAGPGQPDPVQPDAAPVSDSAPQPDTRPPGMSARDCFADDFVDPEAAVGPDYDVFTPVIGSHCAGTDHQDITGIERVVFLGDSVTVGTPPTPSADFYRSELADRLAARFGIEPPNGLWKSANPLEGTSTIQTSGAFSSCAEWGARTDDFITGGMQLDGCFGPSDLDQRTLVVLTMGGNDVAAIAKDGIDGTPVEQLWVDTEAFIQRQRDAVAWLTEPGRFPNGVFVVFANIYEYTDGTALLGSCPGASAAGFDGEWDDPQALIDMMVHANEQFMALAVDSGTDMIFLLESFCGHGFNHDDPNAPCYRGPAADNWFDFTCIHPTPRGHGEIADLFMAVIEE